MSLFSFFNNFSLRAKLLFLLTSVPLVLLSAFLFMVVYFIELDKVSFVFESSANLSKSLAAQTRSDLTTVLAKIQPLLQEYIEVKALSGKSERIFEQDLQLGALAIYAKGTLPVATPQVLLEKSTGQWESFIKESPQIGQWFRELDTQSRIIKPLGEQKILILEKVLDPVKSEDFIFAVIYWAKDLAGIFETKKDLRMYLIDQKGQIIFGPSAKVGSSLTEIIPAKVISAIIANKVLDGAEMVKGFNKSNWLVSFSDTQFANLLTFTMIEKKMALMALTKLLQKSIIFFALLLSINFIISLSSSKQMTSALNHLLAATKKITEGKFDIKLKSNSKDEVGVLTTNFNRMSQEISRLMNETIEKTRMENELKTAQTVQSTLFPKQGLIFEDIQISGYYEPASECGGDWWSYSKVEDKIYLWIGDATGHGAPAALVTSAARSAASIIETLGLSPGYGLTYLNRSIYDVTNGKVMMTFALACLDLSTKELVYSVASHEPPLLVHRSEGEKVRKENLTFLDEQSSPRLGQRRDVEFTESRIQLKDNDLILFYTDGISELRSPAGESLGERKFINIFLESLNSNSAETVVSNMNSRFKEFHQDTPLLDDVTYCVLLNKSAS